jgi:hypothetical protein
MTNNRILIIAPHPDDETLALGGTIAKFASEGNDVHVLVVSGHLPPLYKRKYYDKTVAEALAAFTIMGVSNDCKCCKSFSNRFIIIFTLVKWW